MDRNEKRVDIIKSVIDNNFNGILNLCVRFGKTLVGLSIYQYYQANISKLILIVVPSTFIKNIWYNELQKYNVPIDRLLIATSGEILSLNNPKFKVDLLIVDEAHRFTSPINYHLIKNIINAKSYILLTGSLPHGNRLKMLTDIAPIIYTISEREAISNNWISKFLEFNIPVEFTSIEKERYIKLTSDMSVIFNKYNGLDKLITFNNTFIINDLLHLFKCLKDGYYNPVTKLSLSSLDIATAISKKMNHSNSEEWSIESILFDALELDKIIRKRNLLFSKNKTKIDAVIEIVKRLNLQTLIFTDSVEVCNLITNKINTFSSCFAYHYEVKSQPVFDESIGDYHRYKSGSKKGEPKKYSKEKLLEFAFIKFENYELKSICSINSLNEGFTLKNVECIINISGSSNPIEYIQRTGRGKTISNFDKVLRIYNIYVNSFEHEGKYYKSRDEEKLKFRQNNYSEIIKIPLDEV